jgi:hypothetical protein
MTDSSIGRSTATAYLAPSALDLGGQPDLTLSTALGRTPAGDVWHPTFFTGFAARPDVMAAGLLAVADVAASRYADLGQAKRLANLDPVVTASGDRLRFESFSACNAVYARFDLLPEGIDSGEVGFGTTNVDVNQPLRAALASVPRGELLHLAVGSEELRVSTPAESHAERKVPLPDRWVRGFAETPLLSRATSPRMELKGRAVATFLGGLPRVSSGPGRDLHLLPVGQVPRVVPSAIAGSVPLLGSRRLEAARRIARFATALSVSVAEQGTTSWRFEVPGGSLTLLLTPNPWRGFSGEGSLLELLTHPDAELVGRSLLPHLAWEPWVEPDALATASGHPRPSVDAGLAWLSASGRLGYDIDGVAWFHRELPVDADRILRDNPRLRSARSLTGIRQYAEGWRVPGDHGVYQVRRLVDATQDRWACTCTWEEEHHGTRGPCKHILAVVLATQD